MVEITEFEMIREEEKQRWITKIKQRIEELEKFKLDPYHGGYTDKFVDCKIAELQNLLENEKDG